MENVMKVFVDIPDIVGYVATVDEPFAAQFVFTTSIEYHGIKNNAIIATSIPWQYNAEPGITPGEVYVALYNDILAHCALMEYPTPGQGDIFCWVPTSLSQIFVQVPALA